MNDDQNMLIVFFPLSDAAATRVSEVSTTTSTIGTCYWTYRFIVDIVERSGSTFNDLQLALLYFERLQKKQFVSPVSHTPPGTPSQTTQFTRFGRLDLARPSLGQLSSPPVSPVVARSQPVRPPSSTFASGAPPAPTSTPPSPAASCTLFLACLVLSRKFLHDRYFSNRAWAHLTGVPVATVCAAERLVLAGLEYELWVDPRVGGDGMSEFARFCAGPVEAAMGIVDLKRRVARVRKQEEEASHGARKRRRTEGTAGNGEKEEEEKDGFGARKRLASTVDATQR
ncbi:hypothetical protein DFJ73DRAFT_208741 [Zopfochytrium polystomum]|nr:hypothetical protein DFJ73DRAFT_208741 [Zopfochytrium polystomum]